MTLGSVGSARAARVLRPGHVGSLPALPSEEAARLPRSGALLVLATQPERVARALRERRPDAIRADRDAVAALGRGHAVVAEPRASTLDLAAGTGARLVVAEIAGAELRVGSAVDPAALRALDTHALRSRYLAWLVRALRARPSTSAARTRPDGAPIASPVPRAALLREIEALPAADRVLENERWLVARARGASIPALLHEIGRAREESFRACGEGTGAPLDLDRFDPHYLHLFAWSKASGELAAAYRLVETAPVLAAHGIDGLYTSTLFAYAPEFFARLGPALELGRAFVRPAHQRSLALASIWRALARVIEQGDFRALFGAVSVSADYGRFARRVLSAALLHARPHGALLGHALGRSPLRAEPGFTADSLECLADPALLGAVIGSAAPDGKKLPILIREYEKLGARYVAWNVDRSFANSLDGLAVVDLDALGPLEVERWAARGSAAAQAAH